jgi:hypothetical protein
VRGKS